MLVRYALIVALVVIMDGSAARAAEPSVVPGSPVKVAPGLAARITMEASPARFGTSSELTFRMELRAGDRDQRFGLLVEVPRVGPSSEPYRLEGATIEPTTVPTLSGDGSLTPIASVTLTPPCTSSRRGFAFHGYEPMHQAVDISVSARGTATVTTTFRTGDRLLWPRADLRPTFVLKPRLGADGPGSPSGTIPHEVRLRSSEHPRVTGPTGVHIRLTTSPRTSPTMLKRVRTVAHGREIAVHGTTSPRLVRVPILLETVGPRDIGVRRLSQVVTDERGRFTYRWIPRQRGRYELWARYRSSRRDVLSDYACPRALRVA